MTGRAYTWETNFAETHEESELDKQVNVRTKREFEKTSVVHASSCKPTKKCAMKMKKRRKNDYHIKNL